MKLKSRVLFLLIIFINVLNGAASSVWSDFDTPPTRTVQTAAVKPSAASAADLVALQSADKTGVVLFNDFYRRLVGDQSGVSYKGALLKSLQFYSTYVPGQMAVSKESPFQNIPAADESFYGSLGGSYFALACAPESYPLMIVKTVCLDALTFIKGRTSQLESHFYRSATSDLFIPFKTNGFQGQLALVDNAIAQIQEIITKASARAGSSQKKFQDAFQPVFDNYYQQRDQYIVRWFFTLITQLARTYNETNAQLKNYFFESLPESAALAAQQAVFEQALKRLVTLTSTCTIGNYTLVTTKASDDPSTVFTQKNDFIDAVLKDVAGSLAQISAFAATVSLEKASAVATGKTVPSNQEQPVVLYGNYTDIPAFQTYQSKGSQSDAPISSGSLTADPAFTPIYELFQVLNNWVSDAIRAYGFDLDNTSLWRTKGTSPIVAVPTSQGSVNPVKAQEQALKEFMNASGASSSSLQAQTIFNELVKASEIFAAAAGYYKSSNNGSAAQMYQAKSAALKLVKEQFQKAVSAYQMIDGAPTFALANSATKIQGDYYQEAQEAFGLAAQALKLVDAADLVGYTKQLSAQLGVLRYQSVLQGFVEYYKKYSNAYSQYALEIPRLGDINEEYKGVIATDYQDYLADMFVGFEELLAQAIDHYRQQLSFFFSLSQSDTKETQEAIEQLRASIELLDTFWQGLSGVYRCAVDEKGQQQCTVAQQPLGAYTECMSGSSSKKCLGADNYIEAATSGSLGDVIAWVIFANQQYRTTQYYFEKIDELLVKYPNQLSAYTALQKLFKKNDGTSFTFSEFFALHQARLFVSVGQKLLLGQSWSTQQEGERSASPVCVYLLSLSAACYQQIGLTAQAEGVRGIIQQVLAQNTSWSGVFEKAAGYLKQQVQGPHKTVQEAQSAFQQALAYYQTAYLINPSAVQDDYLRFISSSLMQTTDTKEPQKQKFEGYSEWLARQSATLPFVDLYRASLLYQGYLICTVQQHVQADAFLSAARNALQSFYTQRDALFASVKIDVSTKLSPAEFTKKEQAFQSLLLSERLLHNAQSTASFLKMLYAAHAAQDLEFKPVQGTINGLIGNFYKKGADDLLREQQKNYVQGVSLNSPLDTAFDDIVARYTLAGSYYAQAQDQDNYVLTQIGITNTVAFQTYSSIVPVVSCMVQGVNAGDKDTTTVVSDDQMSLYRLCGQPVALEKIAATYTDDMPLYLLRLKKELIPQEYVKTAMASLQKNDPIGLAVGILFPLYKANLSGQVSNAGLVNAQEYNARYEKQVRRMLSQGVTLCGTVVKGSLSVEKSSIATGEQDAMGKSVMKDVFYLVQKNMPIEPLPRFMGELSSAYQLYNEVPAKLYADGVTAVSVAGQTFVPAHNLAGQKAVQEALYATYLAAAVPYLAHSNQLKNSALYQQIQKLTDADRLKASFGQYSSVYDDIQDTFENILGIYGALETFIQTGAAGKEIINGLQADAYLQWMELNTSLLCGDPTNNRFKEQLNVLINYAQQVSYYASLVKDGAAKKSRATLLLVKALERAGDMLYNSVDTPPSTFYPQATTVYPVAVPLPAQVVKNAAPVYTFHRWKDALKFYMIAAGQLKNGVSEATQPSAELSDLLKELQKKLVLTTSHLAIFHLTRFGYNAFTHCLATLKGDKKGTYPLASVDQKTTDKVSEKNGKIMQDLVSHPEYWDTITIDQVGADPNYPAYLYPTTGAYPKVQLIKDSSGTLIYTCDPKGVPYSLLPQDATSTQFQGVASLQHPTFQKLLKTGLVGAQQASFAQWESGGGAGGTSLNADKAYKFMHDDCALAIYYLMAALDEVGNMFKPPKIDPRSTVISPESITVSREILNVFTRKPAFGVWYDPAGLPVISVQFSDSSAKKGDAQAKAVSRFEFLTSVIGDGDKMNVILDLSNPQKIYPHTLQYWVSQPVCAADMLSPVLEWMDAGLYSVVQTWLSQLHLVARALYWRTYLPGTEYQDAQNQISTQVQQMSKMSNSDFDNYVG